MTPLERTLAKALTEIIIWLDLSDDDVIAEASMQLLEPVIALLQDLPAQDRQAHADLNNQCAQEETDPDRHLTAWETPEPLSLLVLGHGRLGTTRERGHDVRTFHESGSPPSSRNGLVAMMSPE
jgi:hypothetical protein